MRKLLLLISFLILHVYSFTQTDIQRDNRVNAVLKQALAPNSGYSIYGRPNSSMFINIAVLNQSSHTMSWFTCHGRLFDSTRLTDSEYAQVTSKQLDPFVLYQHICNEYLTDIAVAKDIYRLHSDSKVIDSLHSNYHSLFASEILQKANTPLQKLIAIDNVRKHILAQLSYLNCADPFGLQDNPLFKTIKELAGTMIQTKDSTVYYNIDLTSTVTKIGLYKNSPEKLYIYNRLSKLIDSVPVLPTKYNLLLKEKTDVFLLYRGWLELQWQGTMNAITGHTKSIDKNDAVLYRQVNIKNEKSIEKELYSQLNAIETKINALVSPEAKSIEQTIYDTYKNETSEISYIPLLGIGYSLIEKRGLKEYELTNHLGNVLVTLSDKKLGYSSNDSTIDYYNADVVGAQDYYPFGMLQPGRVLNVEKYRYGFNGKENDNEVKGEGNQQDYGMRIYDPRLGRFLSVDPITSQYPQLTPYQFASNSPIFNIDLDGLEGTSWWDRFLTDPVNTLMTGTTWDDLNAAAGDINNQIPAGAIINGSFQAITGRDPVTLKPGASRIEGVGQAIIGGILHASAIHVTAPPVKSAAALEKQMAVNATGVKAAVKKSTTASTVKQVESANGGKVANKPFPEMSVPSVLPKLSEFAWQNNKAMNDIIAKSIHGNVYNKKGLIGEVGFELENGIITPKALGRNLTNESKTYIINVGYKQMQSPGFNEELLQKVIEALNSGQIPTTTNRYQKLLEMKKILTPKSPPVKR